MMETYSYSATHNAFYANSLKTSYAAWPDDATEVDEATFTRFIQSPPDGKIRAAGEDGLPEWTDLPPLSQEELLANAAAEKESRVSEASSMTGIWQTQLLLGIISDDDKSRLTKWMKYIQEVQGIDASSAPDISWPEKPQ